jgi:5-methylcytosine-specific restriction endonuclease McrA
MENQNNRKVICAGCSVKYLIENTSFYRNKRWCGQNQCKDIIDYKVKHANYKKAKKKMMKGTFRHGVSGDLREYIKNRDDFTCRLCFDKQDTKSLQVHHIIPVANGGNDSATNLVLLCSSCHTDLHRNGWEIYTESLFGYTNRIENQQETISN